MSAQPDDDLAQMAYHLPTRNAHVNTYPHPMDAEDTKAGFADDAYDCDCCGKPTPRDQISRGWAYGIETFACEACWL